MKEIEITLTKEQVINGIDINYIFWEMMNEYGIAYKMMQTRDRLHIYFSDDTTSERMAEVQQFVEEITEKLVDSTFDTQNDVLIETINCYNRKAAIVKAIDVNHLENLTVKYFPTATGDLAEGTYVNSQRWYFSRVLTDEERKIVEDAIKAPLAWEKYG